MSQFDVDEQEVDYDIDIGLQKVILLHVVVVECHLHDILHPLIFLLIFVVYLIDVHLIFPELKTFLSRN